MAKWRNFGGMEKNDEMAKNGRMAKNDNKGIKLPKLMKFVDN